MKITLFMQSLESGGVQKVMIGLANGFVKANSNNVVKLIVGDARGALGSELSDRVHLIDFKQRKYHGDFKILASMGRLVAYMRENHGSVIVAAPGFAGVAAVVSKLFTSRTVIVIVDDKLSLLKTRGIKGLISLTLYYITFRFANAIVAAHENAARDLVANLGINSEKVHAIYHPLINHEIIRKTKPITSELEGFLGEGDTLLLAAGRLTSVKDYPNLIKAFAIVTKKHSNAKLVILGEGPDADALSLLVREQNLDNRVRMYGYSDNPLSFMKRADICISSSRQEAFGITLVEALACGTTVVATDCSSGGPREILKNGEYGYLASVGDSNALASAIEKALANPINPSDARRRGAEFSVESSISQYTSLISKVAAL